MNNNQKKLMISIKKTKSLINTVEKMMEEDRYCIDIIQQNLAIIGLLKSMNLKLLEGHLNHCFKNAAQRNDEEVLNKMINELMLVMKIAQNK